MPVRARCPKGFLPSEDTGQISCSPRPRRTSPSTRWSSRSSRSRDDRARRIRTSQASCRSSASAAPAATLNTGRMFIKLKPRAERPPADADHRRSCGRKLVRSPGHQGLPAEPAADPPRRPADQGAYQYTLQGADTDELYAVGAACSRRSWRRCPACRTSRATCRSRSPQLDVDIDRDRRRRSASRAQQIEDALYTAYGSRQVSTIYTPTNQY